MTRILMVCLGNICRSPLAHGILESKLPPEEFYVDSAGTGNYHIGSPPDQRSIAIAIRNGIDISTQKCRQFHVSDFDQFDLIYVMDKSNLSNIVRLARNPQDIAKIKLILEKNHASLLEVPDPYYGNEKDFESVFTLLNDACGNIATTLQNKK
ncbi:MAG: low molecular weight protein-tyrosine-phosphatase [Gelidibacter sp.]